MSNLYEITKKLGRSTKNGSQLVTYSRISSGEIFKGHVIKRKYGTVTRFYALKKGGVHQEILDILNDELAEQEKQSHVILSGSRGNETLQNAKGVY